MLINSDITVVNVLGIHLYFDDGTEKIDTLREGDIASFTYRRDFSKVQGVGKIVDIKTYGIPCTDKVHSVLTVDFSDDYASSVVKIPTEDLIDFDKIVVREAGGIVKMGKTGLGSTRLPSGNNNSSNNCNNTGCLRCKR